MTFMNEYGLLIAVSLPVIAILGAQVALLIAGERGTLLFPGFNRYPAFALGVTSVPVKPVPVAGRAMGNVEPSNDEVERIAA